MRLGLEVPKRGASPLELLGHVRLREGAGRYAFRCPVCRKTFVYDSPDEPLCTGPSESRDDHEPALMVRIEP
jgi:hypothetical protein